MKTKTMSKDAERAACSLILTLADQARPPVYTLDGHAIANDAVLSIAEEYGYSGNDVKKAARLIKAWGYKIGTV